MSNDRLAVTLTVDELRALIREELESVLTDWDRPTPRLLDSNDMAAMLALSTATLSKLRKQGLPTLWAGESPRFEPDAVIAWLRERKRE